MSEKPATAELARRERLIGAHVAAVIRYSVLAAHFDEVGRPAAAREASLTAAAHARCARQIAGLK